MSRRISAQRYRSYAYRVLTGLLIAGTASGVVTLGTLVESDVGNDVAAHQEARNEFYAVLAGAEVTHGGSAATLATDLRSRYEEAGSSSRAARVVVTDFEYDYEGDGYYAGRYKDVADELDLKVFDRNSDRECVQCGRLEPAFGDLAVQALKGDLDSLVVDPANVVTDRSWWAPTWVYVALALLGSSLGSLVARAHESGRYYSRIELRDWSLDGNATVAKLANVVLAPHLVGPQVLLATAPSVRRALSTRVQANKERRALRALVPTAAEAALTDARAILAALSAIEPRTPAVVAATEEARGVLERLERADADLAAVRAEAVASTLVASVRGLDDARAAQLAAERELGATARRS